MACLSVRGRMSPEALRWQILWWQQGQDGPQPLQLMELLPTCFDHLQNKRINWIQGFHMWATGRSKELVNRFQVQPLRDADSVDLRWRQGNAFLLSTQVILRQVVSRPHSEWHWAGWWSRILGNTFYRNLTWIWLESLLTSKDQMTLNLNRLRSLPCLKLNELPHCFNGRLGRLIYANCLGHLGNREVHVCYRLWGPQRKGELCRCNSVLCCVL